MTESGSQGIKRTFTPGFGEPVIFGRHFWTPIRCRRFVPLSPGQLLSVATCDRLGPDDLIHSDLDELARQENTADDHKCSTYFLKRFRTVRTIASTCDTTGSALNPVAGVMSEVLGRCRAMLGKQTYPLSSECSLRSQL